MFMLLFYTNFGTAKIKPSPSSWWSSFSIFHNDDDGELSIYGRFIFYADPIRFEFMIWILISSSSIVGEPSIVFSYVQVSLIEICQFDVLRCVTSLQRMNHKKTKTSFSSPFRLIRLNQHELKGLFSIRESFFPPSESFPLFVFLFKWFLLHEIISLCNRCAIL